MRENEGGFGCESSGDREGKKEKVKYKHVGKEWNKEKNTSEIKRESDEWE